MAERAWNVPPVGGHLVVVVVRRPLALPRRAPRAGGTTTTDALGGSRVGSGRGSRRGSARWIGRSNHDAPCVRRQVPYDYDSEYQDKYMRIACALVQGHVDVDQVV